MSEQRNLLGMRFTRITVIGPPEKNDRGRKWLCQCDCGKIWRVNQQYLLDGKTKSCGCYKRDTHTAPMAIGDKFGSLTIVSRAETPPNRGEFYWLCRCDCGNTKVARGSELRNGNTCRCGKCGRKSSQEHHKTHGMSRSRLYKAWRAMKDRCNGTARKSDRYYGRGITYAPEWENFEPFMEWALSNGYASNLELDRIDNDGNYEPSNCRWATRTQQCRNTSRNVFIEYNGVRMCLAEAALLCGLPYKILQRRIHDGWDTETALSTPPIKSKQRSGYNGGEL